MRLLLGKYANMAETGEAPVKIDVQKLHRPGFTQCTFGKTPAPHAIFVGVAGENRVNLFPMVSGKRGLPERLRLRPDDFIVAILFEFFAIATINELKGTGSGILQDDGNPLYGLFTCSRFQAAFRRGLRLPCLAQRPTIAARSATLSIAPFANMPAILPATRLGLALGGCWPTVTREARLLLVFCQNINSLRPFPGTKCFKNMSLGSK